jgi:hypothetical protein
MTENGKLIAGFKDQTSEDAAVSTGARLGPIRLPVVGFLGESFNPGYEDPEKWWFSSSNSRHRQQIASHHVESHTRQGLESIFEKTASDACAEFEETLSTRYKPEGLCSLALKTGFNNIKAKAYVESLSTKYNKNSVAAINELRDHLYATIEFQTGFEKVKKELKTAKKSNVNHRLDKSKMASTSRALVDMLNKSLVPQAVLRSLEKMTTSDNYCREAVATSDEAFVDQNEKLIFVDSSCSSIKKTLLTASTQIRTDSTYSLIEPFLFNYFKGQRLRGLTAIQGQYN